MTAMSDRLAIVSAERVRDELVKLLLTPPPARRARAARRHRAGRVVLPELPRLRLEVDEHHRHKDVYEHSLTCSTRRSRWRTAPRAGAGPDLVLRWPRCCTTSASRARAGSSRAAACRSTTTRSSART
jgi:poly(A) polymerase